VFLSGQLAADADGNIVAPGDHGAQARFSANRLKETVEALGGRIEDVVDLFTLNHDVRSMDPVNNMWFSEIVKDTPLSEVSAVTCIGMTGLMKFGATSAMRAVADLSPGKRIARTPPSIWWKVQPISGGTKKEKGRFIALAGQVASDGDGYITTPGDFAAQSRYALNRLKEVLAEFGATMDNIVSIIPFHKEPRAWPITLEVAREFFEEGRGPAWTPIGATGLYREGYLHEIYAMAVV
jgi:enamine deaminase RidA (YjgF/YER057c/UK114 family)